MVCPVSIPVCQFVPIFESFGNDIENPLRTSKLSSYHVKFKPGVKCFIPDPDPLLPFADRRLSPLIHSGIRYDIRYITISGIRDEIISSSSFIR